MTEQQKSPLEIASHLTGSVAFLYLVSWWSFSHAQKEVVRERQDYTCANCGDRVPNNFEVHHIKPHCKGGKDSLDNAIGLCGPKKGGNNCHEKFDRLALEQGILWDGTEIDISKKCRQERKSRRIKRKLKRRRR